MICAGAPNAAARACQHHGSRARSGALSRGDKMIRTLLLTVGVAPLLAGCLVAAAAGAAGAVVGAAVGVTGNVIEGAVDVTGAVVDAAIPGDDDKDDKDGDDR